MWKLPFTSWVLALIVALQQVSSVVVLKGGLKVSSLGIGTWAWGDKFYWKYNEKEDVELLNTYRYLVQEGGVNLFDTAEIYGLGKSELLLGRFKRNLTEPASIIATKFAPLPWRLSSESVVSACRDSMDRLGVNKIDLYQIHWPGLIQNEAFWEGIAKCYDRGWISEVGVSNYGANQLRKAHDFLNRRGVPLSTNQIQFSLLSRGAESSGLLKTANELGIVTLAYSPLAQGLLTGKFSENNLPQGPRSALVKSTLPKIDYLLKTMKDIASTKSISAVTEGEETVAPVTASLSQVALNWCIAKGTIPIPGARTLKQAVDNTNALKWTLTAEEVQLLDDTAKASGVQIPTPLQSK